MTDNYDSWHREWEVCNFWRRFNAMWELVGLYELWYSPTTQGNANVLDEQRKLRAKFLHFMGGLRPTPEMLREGERIDEVRDGAGRYRKEFTRHFATTFSDCTCLTCSPPRFKVNWRYDSSKIHFDIDDKTYKVTLL